MKDFILKINTFSKIEITAKCLLLFLLLYSTKLNALYLIAILFIVIITAIVRTDYFKDSKFWILTICLFIPNFIFQYYLVANHYFVMFYMLLVFLLASYFYSDTDNIIRINAKWILAFMMIFAVIHKLLSHQFISGESIGFLMYFGQLFKLFFELFHQNNEILADNSQAINAGISTLSPTLPNLELFSKYFAYVTILVELIFAILLFVKNTAFKNWFFLGFLSLLILTREENGFIALLCILLMMQLKDQDSYIFRTLYLALYVLSVSLVIVGWGKA